MIRGSQHLRILPAAAVLAFLGWAGSLLLWSTFMAYDDEGYVLYSLKAFAEHGSLYETVYTQYGPFFFLLHKGLSLLGLEFTNNTGRILALTFWLGTTGICGALVWRETRRSLLATLATLVAVFIHLHRLTAEPSHPGGLIVLLTALAAWVGTDRRWSAGARAAIIGAIGAMLILTKINVGVFFVAGACAWWALATPALGGRRFLSWCIAAALGALPFMLMRGLLPHEWVRTFAIVAGCSAVAAVVASGRPSAPDLSARVPLAGIVGAAIVAAITLVTALATGTGPGALLEGILLGPLRHPGSYTLAFDWRSGSVALAVIAVPAAVLLSRLPPSRRAPFVLLARFAVILVYAACLAGAFDMSAPAFALSFALSTTWVFVLPTRENDERLPVRAWLALLLVTQVLHIFPVAGSQISWGTVLWVPLAAISLLDAAEHVSSAAMRRVIAAVAAATTVLIAGNYAHVAWQRHQHGDALGMKGAEQLRLPEWLSIAIRMLVRNSQVHGDVLFTMPGMQSFNAWSGMPPPTVVNTTLWFNLLSPAQQSDIQQRLESSPRSVVIVQRDVYELLKSSGIPKQSPLLAWFFENYRRAFSVDSYEFWIRKGRNVAPVNRAELFSGGEGAPTRHKLELIIAPETPCEIASIELRRLRGEISETDGFWNNGNAKILVVPIAQDGSPTTPGTQRALPFQAHGLVRIDIYTDTFPSHGSTGRRFIYLRDSQGRRVGEARFLE